MTQQIMVSLHRAIDRLRMPGILMIRQFDSRGGSAYYVLGSGRLADEDAHKILKLPNLIALKDGLFPNLDQCWRLG